MVNEKPREMTAALVIEGYSLLVIHNIKHGRLRVEPPGGKREEGEKLEACVVREFLEETGGLFVPSRALGVYRTNSPEGPFDVTMYLGKREGGLRVMQPGKHAKLEFCSVNNLFRYQRQNVLVPNLCACLMDLQRVIRKY